MLKRAVFLLLSFMLIASGALSAHAGPCTMKAGAAEVAVVAEHPAHCDMMMDASDKAAPEKPAMPDKQPPCCCPAVMAALPAVDVPDTGAITFARPASFPLDDRAASRTLLPEPRPPKA